MNAAIATSFLDDIIAHPAGDAPRLVFADWLMDRGQEERGEFIAVQCALASEDFRCTCTCEYEHAAGCPESRKKDLRRRQQELLAPRTFWEWFGDLAIPRFARFSTVGINYQTLACTVGYGNEDDFWTLVPRRGFIEEIELPTRDWIGVGCERCRETGRMQIGHGFGYGATCTKCNGKKRYNAHGPVLVQSTPLTRVTLGDREPQRLTEATKSYGWSFERYPNGGYAPPSILPDCLEDASLLMPCRDEEHARKKLSDRLLQWAKNQP